MQQKVRSHRFSCNTGDLSEGRGARSFHPRTWVGTVLPLRVRFDESEREVCGIILNWYDACTVQYRLQDQGVRLHYLSTSLIYMCFSYERRDSARVAGWRGATRELVLRFVDRSVPERSLDMGWSRGDFTLVVFFLGFSGSARGPHFVHEVLVCAGLGMSCFPTRLSAVLTRPRDFEGHLPRLSVTSDLMQLRSTWR